MEIDVGYNIRNSLAEIDNNNKLAPELAESWEASNSATQWVFQLRQLVEFHNGKTLDANDVVATLNYHRGKDSTSGAKAFFESVEDISADGKNTVVVRLNAGNADFPYVLADYHLGIMPADGEGNVNRDGVGTGGYVVERFEPGIRTNLKRFPNYWKEGRAHFDEVEVLTIADVAARMNALSSGALDVIEEVDPKVVDLLGSDPDIKIDVAPSGSHTVMPMFMDVAPFNNNDVRLALKFALDRQVILQTIRRGYGTLGNDHPIGPGMPFYAELPQRHYDPDKAKFHLKKAGFDNLSVSLSVAEGATWPGALDTAVLFKEQAAKAGIEIDIVRESNDAFWSDVWLKKPFVVSLWGARPTPDVIFSIAYAKGAPWNESHFVHERFNKLLVEARAETNDSKRQEMYAEMQSIVRDEGATIVPFFRSHIYARRSNVHHDNNIAGNWQLDGHKAIERWWFA